MVKHTLIVIWQVSSLQVSTASRNYHYHRVQFRTLMIESCWDMPKTFALSFSLSAWRAHFYHQVELSHPLLNVHEAAGCPLMNVESSFDAYADLSRLPLLDSVVKETLRLHATAPNGTVRYYNSKASQLTQKQFTPVIRNYCHCPKMALSGDKC